VSQSAQNAQTQQQMTDTAAAADADDALRTAAAANVLERTTLEKADGTYKSTWKTYKEWIKAELGQTEPPFLTRRNIDHYFTRFVALKAVKPATAKKYVSALQFFADNDMTEHASKGKGSFIVSCFATEEAKRLCGLHLTQGTGG
jgi:hypothetical protein